MKLQKWKNPYTYKWLAATEMPPFLFRSFEYDSESIDLLIMDEAVLLALLCGVRDGPIRFGRISAYQAHLIGAYTNTVWLSHETAVKLEGKHRDPTLHLYRVAHAALSSPMNQMRVHPPNKLNILFQTLPNEIGKRDSFRITVKATRRGGEIYLVSAHKLRGNQWRSTVKKTLSAADWDHRLWLIKQNGK